MNTLPQHKAALLSELGMGLYKIAPGAESRERKSYVHQDDYYIFGVVEQGEFRGLVDFREHCAGPGSLFVICPGQVHRLVTPAQIAGVFLFADASLVDGSARRTFDEYALSPAAVPLDGRTRHELLALADMMLARMDAADEPAGRSLVRQLARAFTGIAAEAVREAALVRTAAGSRQMDITLAFRALLSEEAGRHRQPSWYASRLHLSPAYLNEVVRSVTGMSVSRYIRSELVLRAKRLLAHTGGSVKEIAAALGFDDAAYFSRLFTQTAGISPTAFRQRNLD